VGFYPAEALSKDKDFGKTGLLQRRWKVKKIFSILLALVLVVSLGVATAAPVAAATLTVNKSLPNVPPNYHTIQAAINASSDGDTIMVAAGEYDAFVVDGKENISIISTKGATVTTANNFSIEVGPIEIAWVMAAVYKSENINIEGINFDGSEVSEEDVVGIAYVDSTGSIADLTVENIIGTGLRAGVAIIGDLGTSGVNLSGITAQNSMAGVAVWNAEANLDGCTITDMDYGVSIGWPWVGLYPSSVSMQGSTVSDNDLVGIYVCDNSILEAHFNNIVGNSVYGVWNDGGETVDAAHNWWGYASGPYHPIANPGGEGNPVSDDMNFEPWLEAEAVTETVNNGTVDARDQADTRVVVTGTAMVIVARYPDNPGGDAPPDFNALGKYIDVYVPDTTEVTEIEIRFYYTDDELDEAGVDEESLQLFLWDGSEWVQCSDSGVNTAGIYRYSGYMWAKIRNNTTPSLADLQGTEFGGYAHPSETPRGCFIATAAYGTDTAQELDILREFRDEVLLPNSLGAEFVSLYYKTSPPIANFISQHEVLRTAVRVGFVDPIVAILNWSHALWSARGS
jgi:hypothetical protein